MKNENGLYKFDIQLFAGETVTVGSSTTEPTVYEDYSQNTATEGTLKLYLVSYDGTSANLVVGSFVNSGHLFSGADALYLIQSSTTLDFESIGGSEGTWYSISISGLSNSTQYTVTYQSQWDTNMYGETFPYYDTSITFTTASSTWTVSFDSNGGTAVSDIEDVEDGATITAPTAPTRENYTFAGWFKEEALTNAWVFASDTVTADTTLYAKWVQGAFEKMQEFGRQIVERVNGKVTANTAITGATKPKITYDSKGLVTAGADLARTDIPTTVLYPPTNTQDANYTLVLADDGKLILAGHATNAVKVTIPLNATVEFPTNTEIAIVKYLAGDVTIGTASGATLNGEASTTTFEITDQYGSVAIKKIGTDAWIMTGAFEEVV